MADKKAKTSSPKVNNEQELKQSGSLEQATNLRVEQRAEEYKVPEKKEIPSQESIVTAELKEEIEKMELDETAKTEAKNKADKIEFLGEKEKIMHLLEIAREKGAVFAIQVAKKTNDPYLLDILHDILAREGFYLKLGQSGNNTQPPRQQLPKKP